MEIKSILTTNFDVCYVCGKPRQQFHHVIGAAYRKKSEKYGLIVPICERGCRIKILDDLFFRNLDEGISQELSVR